MEKLSIFSLIRLKKEKSAEKELIRRYKEYENTPSLITKSSTINHFFKTLTNHINTKKLISIKIMEYFSSKIVISAFEEYEDKLFLLAKNDFFIEIICHILKESISFSCTYFSIFLANFIHYNIKNIEFNEIIKTYCSSIFFSYISLNILSKSEEYPLLHHNSYYTFTKKNERTLNFYLDFPNEFDSSIYYKLLNSYPVKNSHLVLKINLISNEEINVFISLLRKHNNSLTTYKQIKDFINDFDNFFLKNTDIITLINVFKDEVLKNTDQYNYIVDFILTLLTRCQNLVTLNFAITCLDFLIYSKSFSRLYKDLEFLAQYESLTASCLTALQKTKNFQAIIRRLFKIDSSYIKFPIMNIIDLSNKLNFRLVIQSIDHPIIQNVFLDKILSNCQLDKLLMSTNLTKKEINELAIFISYYCYYCSNNKLVNYPNIDALIYDFYSNYYNQINISHFFNTALLSLFDTNSKYTKTPNLILANIIYEDELTYIEEQLNNKNFCIEEISLMIEYFNYNQYDRIIELIEENPSKYFKLLSCIDNKLVLEQCLTSIDKKIFIKDNHLSIDKMPLDYSSKETFIEENYLGLLCNLIGEFPICYPNIYKVGINYFQKDVRYCYYENLLNLLSLNALDYDILKEIENNSYIETDEDILSTINKILNYKKIQIS